MEFEFTDDKALWPDWVRELDPTLAYGKCRKIHYRRGSVDVHQDVYEGDTISIDNEGIRVRRPQNP